MSSTKKNAGKEAERPPLKPFDSVLLQDVNTSLTDSSHIVTLPSLPELYVSHSFQGDLPVDRTLRSLKKQVC